jgi:hypothetical protein
LSFVYCTECGFQNSSTANYCSRCGALLDKGETPVEGLEGPALIVRSGGGRAGESFRPAGERTRIGRSPDCDIFLDDVTVSRNHAILVERDGKFSIEDQGSLNGTFVNRRRIDNADLQNGDELQIGKYRLTFVER